MERPERAGLRLYVIFLAIFVVFVLGAYLLGRWQGREAAQELRAEAAASRRALATAAAQSAETLEELRARVRMLEARRQLHLSLLSLERRNFGTAREHLAAAGRELAPMDRPPAGVEPEALSRLAQELQSARLAATEDLSQQRQRILTWTAELDTQIPASEGLQGGGAVTDGEPAAPAEESR